MNIKEIKKILSVELPKHRFKHSKGVAQTARCLAMRYEYDLDTAFLAGLLHDCAQSIPSNDQILLCEEFDIPLSDEERAIGGSVIHQKLGAYYAKNKYGINDKDILNAIGFHTTGHADMSILEKIIFTADYIEPGRNEAPNLTEIRKLAFVDIDQAVYKICTDTIDYLKSNNYPVFSKTIETMNYYKKE